MRETFPEARKKMMALTLEWLARGREKGIDEVQRVIEAEYHIVTEVEGSKGSDTPTFTRNGQPDWAKFWAYQKEKGLDEEKVHAIVGVSSLKENWVGKGKTLEEADEAIDRALEAAKAGATAKRDPETIKSINSLFRACNEDFALQPKQVLAELGTSSQNELTELPSECYRRIAAVRWRHTVEWVNISDLKLDRSIWPRSGFDEEVIERYRDCLQELPSVVVDRETMTVLDGWHRVEAYRREGLTAAPVSFDGCAPHLFLASAYALNVRHGLPVSNSRRDEIILSLHEKGMSQQQIADEMGIHQQRVSEVLSQLPLAVIGTIGRASAITCPACLCGKWQRSTMWGNLPLKGRCGSIISANTSSPSTSGTGAPEIGCPL